VSGALYWKILFELAEEIGFETPRLFSCTKIQIEKPEMKKILGQCHKRLISCACIFIPKVFLLKCRNGIYNVARQHVPNLFHKLIVEHLNLNEKTAFLHNFRFTSIPRFLVMFPHISQCTSYYQNLDPCYIQKLLRLKTFAL